MQYTENHVMPFQQSNTITEVQSKPREGGSWTQEISWGWLRSGWLEFRSRHSDFQFFRKFCMDVALAGPSLEAGAGPGYHPKRPVLTWC